MGSYLNILFYFLLCICEIIIVTNLYHCCGCHTVYFTHSQCTVCFMGQVHSGQGVSEGDSHVLNYMIHHLCLVYSFIFTFYATTAACPIWLHWKPLQSCWIATFPIEHSLWRADCSSYSVVIYLFKYSCKIHMHICHHLLGWFLPAWFSVALHGDLAFPGRSDGKESAYNAGDIGLIPGSGRSSGEGNTYLLQYSCLENSVNRGAWRATVHGIMKSQIWLRYRTWGNTHGVLPKTVVFLTLPPITGHILLPRKCSNRLKFLGYTSHN